jgi:hypothetical protein
MNQIIEKFNERKKLCRVRKIDVLDFLDMSIVYVHNRRVASIDRQFSKFFIQIQSSQNRNLKLKLQQK